MIYVFLSHDIDWGRKGPSIKHIMTRKNRFDEDDLKTDKLNDLYYNLPEYLEIEEKHDVKSTFFFRTYISNPPYPPQSYDVSEYKPEIRELTRNDWEIGLHMDPSSHADLRLIQKEKEALERVAQTKIVGNRVHYTMNNPVLHQNLIRTGFKYDSSTKFYRENIDRKDFGYFKCRELIIFPMTIMDALAFAHLTLAEDDVVKLVKSTIERCRSFPKKEKVITIVWHGCVLKMKKGRQYSNVLDYLTSQRDIEIKRGIDLVEMIEEGKL